MPVSLPYVELLIGAYTLLHFTGACKSGVQKTPLVKRDLILQRHQTFLPQENFQTCNLGLGGETMPQCRAALDVVVKSGKP